jgi:hypothetical protein
MHDATAVRTEGIEALLRCHPRVNAEVDSGYQGLARDFPDQISAPPPKPAKDAPSEQVAAWKQARKQQSSRRICVEHTIAVAVAATLHRPPRILRRDLPGHRRAGLRPHRPALIARGSPDERSRQARPNLNRAPTR